MRFRFACVAALFEAVTVFAGNQPMKFLDVLEFRQVANGSLSEDGKVFAYTVSSLDWKAGKRHTDIWITPAAGGPSRRMTFTADKDESAPALSPDGHWLAFISSRESVPGAGAQSEAGGALYVMAVAGGEARRVTPVGTPVASFAFSRDGRFIAYVAGRGASRQISLYNFATGAVQPLTKHSTGVTALAWAPDSTTVYFNAPDEFSAEDQKRTELKFDVRLVNEAVPPRHLWAIALDSKAERRLTNGDFTVADFRVSKDGRWLTFIGNSNNRYIDPLDRRDSEAYLYDTAKNKLDRLTNNKVSEGTPQVSPDGRWVAYTAPEAYTYFRREVIYLRPAEGGSWRMLGGGGFEGTIRGFAWSADSRTMYFTDGIGVSEEAFAISVESGKVTQLTRHNGSMSALYNADNGWMVVGYEDPTVPRDYYLARAETLARRDQWLRMSDANPQAANFALGTYETVEWKSSDGRRVEGILVKPAGYEPGTKVPLIVQLHGGPAGAYIRNFSAGYGTYTNVFAAGGYAVFQPNYRGSTNYGEKFTMEIAGDYFRQGFDDIMTGVDELIRRGIADPDRMGMMGWSAGGHWSNWTLTHTNRFKAISSGAGAVNWISMYAQTDVHENREFYFKGTPYDNWDHYIAVSPLHYIKNAKTPTLIHVGADDPRVPRPQSEELHMALKKLGVPTEFIVYPRMGHGLTEPRYQMVKMVAEYNWFEKWIKGKQSKGTPGWFDWKEILETVPAEPAPASTSDGAKQ